jgi:two-component system sensor histidine kinase KdpD
VYSRWLQIGNATTVAMTLFMIVLIVAAVARLRVAVVTSIAANLCLNFFFLPPVGTFTIADPHNWVALSAFLLASLVASHLAATARTREAEAIARRDEVARLFDLSRDVLLMPDHPQALAGVAQAIARRFDLAAVAVLLPRGVEWDAFEGGSRSLALDRTALTQAFADAQRSLEFDAYARTYAGHRTVAANGDRVQLIPLRVGTTPVGLLAAAAGRPIEAGTLDALGGVVAIAIERARLLADRQAAALTQRSEQLKTALLASLAHDLRTPLTAIRVAAANLDAAELTAAERRDQRDLIFSELERLTRLFDNVLDMARIDAGPIATETRRAHPSEIVEAARERVKHTLAHHRVAVSIDHDLPVRLDPRLTSVALAHLLENAAHYTPAGSSIDVSGRADADGLTIVVRDHGPGIAREDLPHLFDRFYRGRAGQERRSGTGMGLWIARGMLAAQGGRVWAENCPDGGASFTVFVPADGATPTPAEHVV